MEVGESRTKSVVRRRRDVREIIGKRENKMEVGRAGLNQWLEEGAK